MPASYIPTREAEMRIWAATFATLITADPAKYGLAAGDAFAISAKVNAFDAAYTVAIEPATRTKPTVAAKDQAKIEMLDLLRQYAQQIRSNRGVAVDDKLALGLNIPDGSPTPVPPPSTVPMLNVSQVTPLAHTIRFRDAEAGNSRAKPAGVLGMQLFCVVADAAPASPEGTRFISFVTRDNFTREFQPGDVGKTAYYYGRWQTRTGLTGPWSQIASMTVAG